MVDCIFMGVGGMMGVYSNIFPLIKDQRLNITPSSSRISGCFFKIKEGSQAMTRKMIDGEEYVRIPYIRWFSTFQVERPPLKLVDYQEDKYKFLDGTDIINVDSIREVPDYDGVMGVPPNFLDVWCSEQFDLLGVTHRGKIDGKQKWVRILIKKKLQ